MKPTIAHTKPETIAGGEQMGKPGKAEYGIAQAVVDEAGTEVRTHSGKLSIYPELDPALPEVHFG